MLKLNSWRINKYSQFKCSNLSQNCPWLQHGYMYTSWGHVTWLFLLGNTCSNHCDVTVRFVTLNSYCALSQNRQQNSHYTPRNEVRGGFIWFTLSVCLSVRLSVCLSVCSLTFRVRPVASTVQDGFFPYLAQMINSMRVCVACDEPWPWPISSRSFGHDLENCVRSVASTVLDGFFLYLAQTITIIRGCVACYAFFRIWKFKFLANLKKISALTLKKKIYSSQWILSIFTTNDH